MNSEEIAYLINTTPKYFYLLPLHIGLIRRYAPSLKWRIFLATEVPEHPICVALEKEGVEILTLRKEKSGFLMSRAAALEMLPPEIEYVLPMQEDFLLDRCPDDIVLQKCCTVFSNHKNVSSIRLMPCPGPSEKDEFYFDESFISLKKLVPENDPYMFTFQATLWRKEEITKWYLRLCEQFESDYPNTMSEEERRIAEIRSNYAENARGQGYFKEWLCTNGKVHLAWKRVHKFPNAVYLSPWPYRPTAVVGGKLESWAIELGKREGFPLMSQ